jgi:hypothetical protein
LKWVVSKQHVVELNAKPENWHRFWKSVSAAGVWQWNERYDNLGILDGIQWELQMEYQGRCIKTRGSNAFPGWPRPNFPKSVAFGQFMEALRILTGRRLDR